MIHYRTDEEIALIRASALLVGQTIAELARTIRPGVTTRQLDSLADQFIRDHQAQPSFLNFNGYPFATCISVNDAVVHGFPNDDALREGDIVSIDVGVYKNGFHGDSAYTFAIAGASPEAMQLLRVTKQSLLLGASKAVPGNRVGDIGYAIQQYCEKEHGFGVVRELVGHGLGRSLHEDPQVPNTGRRGSGIKLREGMVLAIEPMINLGTRDIWYDNDGWTVRTRDGKVSAHFEHDVWVKKGGYELLSSFEAIEAAEKANSHLDAV